jgi:hypothetical protein
MMPDRNQNRLRAIIYWMALVRPVGSHEAHTQYREPYSIQPIVIGSPKSCEG